MPYLEQSCALSLNTISSIIFYFKKYMNIAIFKESVASIEAKMIRLIRFGQYITHFSLTIQENY